MEENRTRTGKDSIFALDIGTRSIIGVVGYLEDDIFQVEAWEQVEHPKRAMIDGQIEDIAQVARVAGMVKERLEEKLGRTLHRVAVAAAGRALKTCRTNWTMDLPSTPVDAQLVYQLENDAVNEARRQLDKGEDNTQYYCVGHSVVRYAIDGYPFSSILDHHGEKAEVDIIATFLPTEVVTSLRRCMELIDLDIDTLTLEPIAAMRAVLPADVRLLNLAMVDIGAGTADIALTRDGTVSGYTMATVAGDEITEAIIRKCLVDFDTAEHIKLSLEEEETVSFTDILGHEQSMPTADILDAISVSVEMLAKVIGDKISECNEGPPTAVFLVGGGSRTPGLCPTVAEKLGLPKDKVAVAGGNFAGRIINADANMNSPEFATPVGIALTAADEAASGRASIIINGRNVRLYTHEASSVMDVLLLSGYTYSDLMGRNGHSVTFQLNGERKVARGGQYSVAEITLNGKPASLTSPVANGDTIDITPATSGEDAHVTIADYAMGAVPLNVTLNGSKVKAGLLAFLNGTPVPPETSIGELDDVEISTLATVGDLCRSYGVPTDHPTLTRNSEPTTPDTLLQEGDHISTRTAPVAGSAPAGDAAADTAAPEAATSDTLAGPATEPAAAVPAEAPAPVAEAPAPALPTEAPAPAETPVSMPEVAAPAPEPAAPESTGLPADTNDTTLATVPAPEAPAETPASAAPAVTEAAPAPAAPTAAEPPAAEMPAAAPPAEAPAPQPTEPAAPMAAPAPEELPASLKADALMRDFESSAAPPASGGGSLRINLNGRTVVLPPKPGGNSHFLLDMLPLVDIDPNNPKGKVIIRLNEKDGSYLDELTSGDSVEIRWEEEG